jgi:hypothetical protein
MTAASRGPGLFSIFSESNDLVYRTRREPFLFSVLGQAAILVIIMYFSSCIVVHPHDDVRPFSNFSDRLLIFAGRNGGGGGALDALSASPGNLPRASLATQIAPPAVIVPKEMPRLPVEPTVVVAPEIKFPEGGRLGDPASAITGWLSSGSGGLAVSVRGVAGESVHPMDRELVRGQRASTQQAGWESRSRRRFTVRNRVSPRRPARRRRRSCNVAVGSRQGRPPV